MSFPHSIWSGVFTIFGVPLRCHVLEDGRRIIEEDSVTALFSVLETEALLDSGEHEAFGLWLRGKGVPLRGSSSTQEKKETPCDTTATG
jgi:hypothetical protein